MIWIEICIVWHLISPVFCLVMSCLTFRSLTIVGVGELQQCMLNSRAIQKREPYLLLTTWEGYRICGWRKIYVNWLGYLTELVQWNRRGMMIFQNPFNVSYFQIEFIGFDTSDTLQEKCLDLKIVLIVSFRWKMYYRLRKISILLTFLTMTTCGVVNNIVEHNKQWRQYNWHVYNCFEYWNRLSNTLEISR